MREYTKRYEIKVNIKRAALSRVVVLHMNSWPWLNISQCVNKGKYITIDINMGKFITVRVNMGENVKINRKKCKTYM